MIDWAALEHAYGSAEDLPELLEGLAGGSDEADWNDLWSCVCHQGTVYTASAAVLPWLLEQATRRPAQERLDPLFLAGAIVVGFLGGGARPKSAAAAIEPHRDTVAAFHALTRATLAEGPFEMADMVYLLQTERAFAGDVVWGRRLDGLAGDELTGECPACAHELYLAMGDGEFFATAEDDAGHPEVVRTPLRPAEVGALSDVGAALHRDALTLGSYELAGLLRHAFGRGTCPACRADFAVEAAVAAAA